MIKPGVPCFVVDDGGEWDDEYRRYIGHVCTVFRVGVERCNCGCGMVAVCAIRMHDGELLSCQRWSILRPIIPPDSVTDEPANAERGEGVPA